MNELQLTIVAFLIELGVPLILFLLVIRTPKYRKRLIVPLGSTLPFLFVYVSIAITYMFYPADNLFAISAVWIMSFGLYIVTVIIAFLLSFIPKPSNLAIRLFSGMACAPISYLVLG